jgi:hypothetical protein
MSAYSLDETITQQQIRTQLLAERGAGLQPRGKVLAAPTAANPNGFWATRPIIIDRSHWDPQMDHMALKGRISGLIGKMGEVDDRHMINGTDFEVYKDETWPGTVQGAYDIDVPCGSYLFYNPAYWLNAQVSKQYLEKQELLWDDPTKRMLWARAVLREDPQLRLIVEQIKITRQGYLDKPEMLIDLPSRAVNFVSLDMERWWRYYSQWLANKSTAKRIDEGDFSWMDFSTVLMLERIAKFQRLGLLPSGVKFAPATIPYTGLNFVKNYYPKFEERITRNVGAGETIGRSWIAHYYYWGGSPVSTTIEGIRSQYLATIPDAWRPTAKYGRVSLVQISGDFFKIPEFRDALGRPVGVDINVWLADQADFFRWCGYVPRGDQPADPGGGGETGGGSQPSTEWMASIEKRIAELERWRKS